MMMEMGSLENAYWKYWKLKETKTNFIWIYSNTLFLGDVNAATDIFSLFSLFFLQNAIDDLLRLHIREPLIHFM